jgi:hypothetical protein
VETVSDKKGQRAEINSANSGKSDGPMNRKRGTMKMQVIERGRAVPKAEQKAVLLDMTHRFRARQEQVRVQRQVPRLSEAPDRLSVAKAMYAVEDRLVRAFWTIARLPGERIGGNGRCGIDYVPGESDREAGYRDAAGGDWSSVAPRPAVPTAKEIDQAKDALDWLLLLEDERLRRILVAGATSKRGDVERGLSWRRIGPLFGYTERHLRNKYREALRTIVTELTLARLGR